MPRSIANSRCAVSRTPRRWQRLNALSADTGAALVARGIATLLLLALLGAGAVGAVRGLRHAWFRGNPRFTLRELSITTGNTVSAEVVRQVTGIRESVNLFAFDLSRVRADFLRNLPNVRDIRLERCLPNALHITVYERIPMARLSRNGRVVTDFDGYLFNVPSTQEPLADMLPVLASEEWASLQPGQRLGERPRTALMVLDTAESLRLGFRTAELDTTGPYALLLLTTDRREVALPWEALGDRTVIRTMLQMASAAMASSRASTANRFDVSPEDGKVYARYE